MKRGTWLAVAVSLMLPAAALAQGSAIQGQVRDSSLGIFPDVKVTISGPALARPLQTVSAEAGAYQFTNLPDGTYQVLFDPSMAASCPAFSKVLKTDVIVVSGVITQIDASLPVGAHDVTVLARPDNDMVQVTTSRAAAGPDVAVNLER